MSDVDWKTRLVDKVLGNPIVGIPLAIGLASLFVAIAGFPPKIDPNSRTSKLFFVFAAISLLICGIALLFKKGERKLAADAITVSTVPPSPLVQHIVGRYRAEADPNYVNTVSSLGGELLKIYNPAWDGVGLFDGKTYCGIFKYNETDKKRRGIYGVHWAELICEKGEWRLKVQGWEMNERSGLTPWKTHSDWYRED